MTTTLDERTTIWRLRNMHNIKPKAIARLFPNVPQSTIRRITSTWNPETPTPKETTPVDFPPPSKKTSVERTNDEITFTADIPMGTTYAGGNRITTLEELVEATNIDLDRWTITHSKVGTWESAMKSADFTPIITTLYKVHASLIPNKTGLETLMLEAMREEIREDTPPTKHLEYKEREPTGRLLEISLPDMHFGKLALEEETGQEYNIEIAEKLFQKACAKLISDALADRNIPDLILLPLGNDLFNVDNAYLTTFANTPQENTHSIKALFKKVKNIMRDTITAISEVAPVRVIMVPGNHDKTISYFLAEALEDIFWNNNRIEVINTANRFQYISWGKTLLGFTHGDKVQHARLPFLMVNDQPVKFSQAIWKEWHLGHKHTKKTTDFSTPVSTHKGVIVRELPSLTAADNWHAERGMKLQSRTGEAYVWSKTTGLLATYTVNLVDIL